MSDFAELEEKCGTYESVFNDDTSTGSVLGGFFYHDVSRLRFAFTRFDGDSLEDFQNREKELISRYIPKDRLDQSPEVFDWLLN